MPTPAAVEPPTPENVHLYRAATLAWRTAWREELRRNDGNHRLANPHVPLQVAVQELAPEMTLDQARTFAQKATAWAAQAHPCLVLARNAQGMSRPDGGRIEGRDGCEKAAVFPRFLHSAYKSEGLKG